MGHKPNHSQGGVMSESSPPQSPSWLKRRGAALRNWWKGGEVRQDYYDTVQSQLVVLTGWRIS